MKFAVVAGGGKSEYAVNSFEELITVDFMTEDSETTGIHRISPPPQVEIGFQTMFILYNFEVQGHSVFSNINCIQANDFNSTPFPFSMLR